jgi:hypothetical protein
VVGTADDAPAAPARPIVSVPALRWLGLAAGLGAAAVAGYVVLRAPAAPVAGPGPAGTAAEVAAGAAGAQPPPSALGAPPAQRDAGASHDARPAPAQVRLKIITRPGDATVMLDGKRLGRTPFNKAVPSAPGKHVLKLSKRGYITLVVDVDLTADVNHELRLSSAR